MISKKLEKTINSQIEKEGYSSNLYLAMASWAEQEGFEGISQWLYAQASEENMHMLKFVKYLNERGGKAIIPAFKLPPDKFKSPKEMFDQVLHHEEFITKSINEIVAQCIEEKDYTTQNFLQWYVNEQIQEERSARAIIDKLKMLGPTNLYLFDRDIMSMRAAAAAADVAPA
ncbi:MAG: ferritin [Bacteroidota bacterium]